MQGNRLSSVAPLTQIRHRLIKPCDGVHVRMDEGTPSSPFERTCPAGVIRAGLLCIRTLEERAILSGLPLAIEKVEGLLQGIRFFVFLL